MAKKLQGTLAAACLMLFTGASAQPVQSASRPYPNAAYVGFTFDHDAPWYQACLRVQNVHPAHAAPAVPPSCRAYNYYDKLHQALTSDAEWAGVRACALAAHDNAVLTMLYANGLGVPRNLDVATHYACSATDSLPGFEYRINELQALKSGERTGRYDQCDDRSSGAMQAVCAEIDDRQAEKIRTAFIARLRRQLPASQQAALDDLVAAGRAYADARPGETDGHGSAAAAMATAAEARENEWLREHLAAFEKGDFNLSSPAELPEDEAELNRLFGAIMATPSATVSDLTVTKSSVRAAQALWLAYRDAWIRFAALRYPAVPSEAVKVELTTWRAHLLRELAPPAS